MNQAFIINDDLVYQAHKQLWQVTGMLSGQHLTFCIPASKVGNEIEITQALKFDIESLLEDWLEDNEPESQIIEL